MLYGDFNEKLKLWEIEFGFWYPIDEIWGRGILFWWFIIFWFWLLGDGWWTKFIFGFYVPIYWNFGDGKKFDGLYNTYWRIGYSTGWIDKGL